MKQERTYYLPLARYPGIRLALLLSAGIISGSVIEAEAAQLMVLFALVVILYIIVEQADENRYLPVVSGWPNAAYLTVIPVTGLLLITFENESRDLHQKSTEQLLLYAWEDAEMEGTIRNVFRSSSGRYNKDFKVEQTKVDGRIWSHPYLIRLYGEKDRPAAAPGMKARVKVRLFDLDEPVNPGQFDYRFFLNRQNIFVHGEIRQISITDSTGFARDFPAVNWQILRNYIHSRIDELFTDESRSIAKALLTGYKQELDREDRQHFARAGLSHIMAVSGLHVGFIVAPFWLIIPWFWQWRFGAAAGLFLILCMLLLYAGLTGFSASVSRASLMAFLLCTGKIMRRQRESLNLMGVSAVVLLLIDPQQLFDIGFQLSYGAVTVIFLLLPVVQDTLPHNFRYSKPGKLTMIVLVSVIVQIGLFPILVWYFGEFSVIGPVANALVVPVLSAVVPLSFIFIFMSDFLPKIVSLLNQPNDYALQWINFIAGSFGNWEGSWISLQIDSPLIFFLWLSMIGFIASIRIPGLRIRFLTMKLCMIIVLLVFSFSDSLRPAKLQVTLLDVGQGDAIHILTPNGRHLLIDTGRWSPLRNSGERVLLPYFESKAIDKLDAVILSHPHADHIGGMPALLENMDIEKIYHCGYEYDSVLFKTYRRLALKSQVQMRAVKKGDMIHMDPSIRIFVVGPDGNRHNANPNDHSVAVLIVYNQSRFLFTGDAEQNQERRIAERYGDFLQADFYKMGHHASRTSTNFHLLQYVQPRKAAASLSFRNRFNHPHPRAISRINHYTEKIYFTSLEGALLFESDGKIIVKQ